MTVSEHWIFQLALAEMLGAQGTFVAKDRLSLPFCKQDLDDPFVAIEPSHRLVVMPGGGRFLCEDPVLADGYHRDGPIVLATDGLDKTDISRSVEQIGKTPDILVHRGESLPYPGFEAIFADVFAAQPADNFVQKLISRANRYQAGEKDPLDSVRLTCERNPFMKGLKFNADLSTVVEFAPLPLIRETDPSIALVHVLREELSLRRRQSVTLRVPIFALPEPEIWIRLMGNDRTVSVVPGGSGNGGAVSIVDRTRTMGTTILKLALSRRHRSTADIQISGHNVIVDTVMVGLPAPVNVKAAREIDPLDRFSDPLGAYETTKL